MSIATIDQRRAAHAWKAVQVAKKLKNNEPKKFGGQAKKLPARILSAGLGQSLTFVLAKNYSDLLLQVIADWTLNKGAFPSNLPEREKLIQKIIDGDADTLRRHTAETLAYLGWLIRFAEAEGLTDFDEGDGQ